MSAYELRYRHLFSFWRFDVGLTPSWHFGYEIQPSMVTRPEYYLQLCVIPAIVIRIGIGACNCARCKALYG